MRPRFEWRLRSRSLTLGERTLIMAVVNVTPDSFSDGGNFFDCDCAVDHALHLLAEGADILDVGGESTRPGKREAVTADEEKRRVLPVIEGVLRNAPGAIVSIDTYKAEVASAALAAGAEIINDVSGFTWDDEMLPTLVTHECGCVLMHTRGRPNQWASLPRLAQEQVMPLVLTQLRGLSKRALAAGVARDRMVLDPGFGFGKRLEENFPLLAHFSELHQLGFPLLSGTSRKSFVAKAAGLSNAAPIQRLAGTLATVTASVLEGAHVIRVHEVGPNLEAANVADALLRS